MKITIDGDVHPAGQKVDKRIRLRGQPKRTVESVSLDAKAATKRYKRSLWWTYGVVYLAMFVGFLLSLPKVTSGAAAIGFFMVVILFVVLIVYFHRRDIRRWRERSAVRLADLPPAGTKASASADALTISGTAYPWTALKVETLDFALKRAKRSSWLEVDRVRILASDGKAIVLDTFGYTNGTKLIDMAAEKLWPQVQPVINGEHA